MTGDDLNTMIDQANAAARAAIQNLREARALIFDVPEELTSTKPHQNTHNTHRASTLTTASQGETETLDDL